MAPEFEFSLLPGQTIDDLTDEEKLAFLSNPASAEVLQALPQFAGGATSSRDAAIAAAGKQIELLQSEENRLQREALQSQTLGNGDLLATTFISLVPTILGAALSGKKGALAGAQQGLLGGADAVKGLAEENKKKQERKLLEAKALTDDIKTARDLYSRQLEGKFDAEEAKQRAIESDARLGRTLEASAARQERGISAAMTKAQLQSELRRIESQEADTRRALIRSDEIRQKFQNDLTLLAERAENARGQQKTAIEAQMALLQERIGAEQKLAEQKNGYAQSLQEERLRVQQLLQGERLDFQGQEGEKNREATKENTRYVQEQIGGRQEKQIAATAEEGAKNREAAKERAALYRPNTVFLDENLAKTFSERLRTLGYSEEATKSFQPGKLTVSQASALFRSLSESKQNRYAQQVPREVTEKITAVLTSQPQMGLLTKAIRSYIAQNGANSLGSLAASSFDKYLPLSDRQEIAASLQKIALTTASGIQAQLNGKELAAITDWLTTGAALNKVANVNGVPVSVLERRLLSLLTDAKVSAINELRSYGTIPQNREAAQALFDTNASFLALTPPGATIGYDKKTKRPAVFKVGDEVKKLPTDLFSPELTSLISGAY